MRKIIDLTGQRFGRLVVIQIGEPLPNGTGKTSRGWLCQCDCGNKTTVLGNGLKNGKTKSCGCFNREQTSKRERTHGMSKTSTYDIWSSMKRRCYNKKSEGYQWYGARGITVCARWRYSFENFHADMGERPEGRTLERINNDKGYSPDNCRWATCKEQGRNQRTNRIINYGGKKQCLAEWAEELGLNYRTLQDRLRNYPPQIAFNM